MNNSLPVLPIPAPLRGAEVGTFAHRTVAVRLPEIGRRILAENHFPAQVVEGLQALLAELPDGLVHSLPDTSAPDWADWQQYLAPYPGLSWLEVPWFFAETYFYRRVLSAAGYFEPGSGLAADPYTYQKRLGLQTFAAQIEAACAQVNGWHLGGKSAGFGDLLADLLLANLWGNQVDLSIWPAGQAERPDHTSSAVQVSHLLCNHTADAVELILSLLGKSCRVDVLLDNAGLELVQDLLLADALLRHNLAGVVRLHAKAHPTFVSDAIIPDVFRTLDHLVQMGSAEAQEVSKRLRGYVEGERLQVRGHFFWTSPLSMWEMPAALRQELSEAALVISKGDANYRRLLGDRHWHFAAPLSGVWSYMPTSLLALRVSKSELMIGLQPGQAQAMAERDPHWMINGKWGVIQLYRNSLLTTNQP